MTQQIGGRTSRSSTVALRDASSLLGNVEIARTQIVCTEDLAREKKEKDMHEPELLGLLGRKFELRYYEDGIEKIARQKSSRLADRNQESTVPCVWKSRA
jgi:hypothetical protein